MTRGKPVVKVTDVSAGCDPVVASTNSCASGNTRDAVGPGVVSAAGGLLPHPRAVAAITSKGQVVLRLVLSNISTAPSRQVNRER
jgi:hypothetical protein